MPLLTSIMAASRRRFDPLSLSPALWLSDTGSSAGTWPDISGNGRDATQATASAQPAIITNALNGRQVRRFDGSGDTMTFASPSVSTVATWFIVSKTTDTQYLTIRDSVSNAPYFDATQSNTASPTANSGSVSLFVNGVGAAYNRGTLLTARGSSANILTASGVNQSVTIHAIMAYPNYDALIDIAEILVYPTALSTADQRNVEIYLANKWGITLAP